MSWINRNILDDLRENKITPARTNSTYLDSVQSWYWNIIIESDLSSTDCVTLDDWVIKESVDFTEYVKRLWENSNGRYNAVIRHTEFMAKPVVIPGINSCTSS